MPSYTPSNQEVTGFNSSLVFAPNELNFVKSWVNPRDAAKITLSGSNITGAIDSTVNGNDFTAPGYKMVLVDLGGGLKVMRSNGAGSMDCSTMAIGGNNARTVIAVIKNNTSTKDAFIFNPTAEGNLWFGLGKKISDTYDLPAGQFVIAAWVLPKYGFSSDRKVYINGGSPKQQDYTVNTFLGAATDTPLYSYNNVFRIGSNDVVDGYDIGDVVVCDSELNNTQLDIVTKYLATTWSITVTPHQTPNQLYMGTVDGELIYLPRPKLYSELYALGLQGQSLMDGYGNLATDLPPKLKIRNPYITMWRTDIFGNSSISGYGLKAGETSIQDPPAVGDDLPALFELHKLYGRRIIGYKRAQGGTQLNPTAGNDWHPDSGELHTQFINQYNSMVAYYTARGYTIKNLGVLRSQGESDADSSVDAAAYQTNVTYQNLKTRQDLGNLTLPIIQYNLNKVGAQYWGGVLATYLGYYNTINTAMATVAAADANYYVIDSQKYPMAPDKIHRSVPGHMMAGMEAANLIFQL